jgi:hypothetical protein
MNARSLGQINTFSPTKNVTPPPAKASPSISGGSKGTGNRSSDSMNLSGPKRNFSSGPHQANTMSAKQSPAAAEALGWLSSWLPSAGPAPVQATKKPMPNPNKAQGLESLLNGSQTRQIQVSNSSMLKGTDIGVANVPPKNGPTPKNSSIPANDKGTLHFGG